MVVLTGASSGVGRATTRAFAATGAKLGLIARSEEALENARREVEAAGGQALTLPLDVSDAQAVEAAAVQVEDALGPIDVWVNNAMSAVLAPFEETSLDDFRRVTEVAYLGYVHGTRAALARMRPRDRGTIVQVGSSLSYRGIPLQASYCGAKHAIRGFTDSVRCELRHQRSNVRITMVQLPAINTPQFASVRTGLRRHPMPVPPIYQPEVAAEAIVWAAAHRRREVWLGASTYATIAGNKLAPWLADRYLARTGYDAQQTDEPIDPDRPDYLWQPLPGDQGAHGRFDAQARPQSRMLWVTKHRDWLLAAGAAALTAGSLASRR